MLPSYPLSTSADLNILMDEIGDRRIVLLGEASHGTHEYYTWRSAITRRLVKEKGFTFIAVEGDWPACYSLNRWIKSYPDTPARATDALKAFDRWPTWMWANWEVTALADWLKTHNTGLQEAHKTGFYGLDVYSLWESLEEIVRYLSRHDGRLVEAAQKAFRCFEPFAEDPADYARATTRLIPADCEDEVVEMLQRLQTQRRSFPGDREEQFYTEQNALVAVNAERFYKAMMRGGESSWNVRDEHMMETLTRLLDFHSPTSKAIVWEHNTHVGDARYTDMADDGMWNIGQLAREQYGNHNVYIVGFGSYKGTVIASDYWEGPTEVMEVPPGRTGSWEAMLHEDSLNDKLLLSRELLEHDPELKKRIGHRAIGVVYHPERERYGNYVPTIVPERYDAFLFIDETRALLPLDIKADTHKAPETYPWSF